MFRRWHRYPWFLPWHLRQFLPRDLRQCLPRTCIPTALPMIASPVWTLAFADGRRRIRAWSCVLTRTSILFVMTLGMTTAPTLSRQKISVASKCKTKRISKPASDRQIVQPVSTPTLRRVIRALPALAAGLKRQCQPFVDIRPNFLGTASSRASRVLPPMKKCAKGVPIATVAWSWSRRVGAGDGTASANPAVIAIMAMLAFRPFGSGAPLRRHAKTLRCLRRMKSSATLAVKAARRRFLVKLARAGSNPMGRLANSPALFAVKIYPAAAPIFATKNFATCTLA